jgi:two-component system, LytTR family, response regulator
MMRVLVVDDEPPARSALVKLLSRRTDIDEFEVAEDAVQALTHLAKGHFDLLLLDIHMPEMSGLELIEYLGKQSGPLPSVIFVTAHDEHAVEAFHRRAVDYVLKPFVPARVHEALDVAIRRSSQERAERIVEMLKDLRLRPERSSRIAIKDKGRVVFVDVTDITSVEASANYVLLQQKSGAHLLRETIATVAEKLKPHGFIRIHRSVLVNSQQIESIQPGVGTEYVLRTKNGKEYHVTRTYRENLRDLAAFWIGSEAFDLD